MFGFGCDVSELDCDDSEDDTVSSVIVFSAARFTFSVFSSAGLSTAGSFAVIRDLWLCRLITFNFSTTVHLHEQTENNSRIIETK